MKICYIDAFSGISGDMMMGALVDAGVDSSAIVAGLDSLATGADFTFESTRRRGIGATKLRVARTDSHEHRHLGGILNMIDCADLPARVKANATAIFTRLGEAESTVHQMPLERVHFHEVGAIDSIADIVGICLGLELSGVAELQCSPINVGSGTVETSHGTLSVPAPATSALLTNLPVYSRGPSVELTTPTGAAIVSTLCKNFGSLPPMQISSIRYGAGDRDFPEHANLLRLMFGESTDARAVW